MGRVLTSARPDEVRTDPAVVSAYLGTTKAAV
jgi:ABC-type branched-subunit amino acid transport system ATPase component